MKLMQLSGAPYTLESIIKTSDGFYLGQLEGDIGYNQFIGSPHKARLESTKQLMNTYWREFSEDEKIDVITLAKGMGINLRKEIGLKYSRSYD